MEISLFSPNAEDGHVTRGLVRAEVSIVNYDEQQWKVILLDADDSFDVVIHYPTSEREVVWSLAKEPPRDEEEPDE